MNLKVKTFVETSWFQRFIMAVILVNSVTIGIQTAPLTPEVATALAVFDIVCLMIYIVEAVLKLIAYGKNYFKDPWNDFDFVIILLCLIPTTLLPIPVQVARVFRVFRSFRVLRLVSSFRQLRVIVEAVGKSIPGVFWTAVLLSIVYYVFAVIGTTLFGKTFPEWFGDLGSSFYTLFQVMTLESWSMGISRPVMEAYPWAWAYFVPFVVISAFIVVNVIVGIIVGAIDETQQQVRKDEAERSNETVLTEIRKMKLQLEHLEALAEKEQEESAKKE